MERWLSEALLEVCEPETREGREHYDLGPMSITPPGASFREAWGGYTWLESCSTSAARGELVRVEQEHDRLTEAIIASPTPAMRDKIAGRARELEAEIARLRAGASGLAGRVRALMTDLSDTHRRIIGARKDLAGRSSTRRLKALHEVIERIVVHHELSGMRGGKPIAWVAWVRIEPRLLGDQATAATLGEERPPGRACSS